MAATGQPIFAHPCVTQLCPPWCHTVQPIFKNLCVSHTAPPTLVSYSSGSLEMKTWALAARAAASTSASLASGRPYRMFSAAGRASSAQPGCVARCFGGNGDGQQEQQETQQGRAELAQQCLPSSRRQRRSPLTVMLNSTGSCPTRDSRSRSQRRLSSRMFLPSSKTCQTRTGSRRRRCPQSALCRGGHAEDGALACSPCSTDRSEARQTATTACACRQEAPMSPGSGGKRGSSGSISCRLRLPAKSSPPGRRAGRKSARSARSRCSCRCRSRRPAPPYAPGAQSG